MAFCTKCGQPLRSERPFCSFCGSPQTRKDAQPRYQQPAAPAKAVGQEPEAPRTGHVVRKAQKPVPTRFWLIGGGALLLLAGGIFWWRSRQPLVAAQALTDSITTVMNDTSSVASQPSAPTASSDYDVLANLRTDGVYSIVPTQAYLYQAPANNARSNKYLRQGARFDLEEVSGNFGLGTFHLSGQRQKGWISLADLEDNGLPEAKYPGGPDAWISYVASHLNNDVALHAGLTESSYVVFLAFEVGADGSIGRFKELNDVPGPLVQEAQRLVRDGGSWQPAYDNGRPVPTIVRKAFSFYIVP